MDVLRSWTCCDACGRPAVFDSLLQPSTAFYSLFLQSLLQHELTRHSLSLFAPFEKGKKNPRKMAPKAEDILVVLPGDGSEGAPVIFDKKMTYKRAFKFMKTHALEKAYVKRVFVVRGVIK